MDERGDPGRERRERPFPDEGAGRWPLAAAGAGLILAFVAASAAAVAGLGAPAARVRQPIAFDHRLHAKQNAIECSTCHAWSAEAPSGLPASDVCATCHAEPVGKTAEEAKLVAMLRGGGPLAWRPLYAEPRHVFFTHRRHVSIAGIDCEACHRGMAEARGPPERVRRLRMQDCVGCHRRSGAPTGCTACHR